MQRRTFLALALSVAGGTWLAGCGGGGNGSSSGRRTTGAVTGILARDSSGALLLIRATDTVPSGATPLGGATVRLTGGGATARSEASGRFVLQGIPAGLRSLTIEGAGLASPTVLPLTVVGNATMDLGIPPVARAAAWDRAKAALTTAGITDLNALTILSPQQPLPAGVLVVPRLDAGEITAGVPGAKTLTRSAWFFFCDDRVGQPFAHKVRYVYVDTETGEATTEERSSWPTFNAQHFYARAERYGASPDLVQPGSMPDFPSRSLAAPLPAGRLSSAGGPTRAEDDGKLYGVTVYGFRESLTANLGLGQLPGHAGIPTDGVADTVAHNDDFGDSTFKARVLQVTREIREQAGSKDLFLLDINCHSNIDADGQYFMWLPNPDTESPEGDGSGQTSNPDEMLRIEELGLPSVVACRILVIAGTCYAGHWVAYARQNLDVSGKEVTVFASSPTTLPGYGFLTRGEGAKNALFFREEIGKQPADAGQAGLIAAAEAAVERGKTHFEEETRKEFPDEPFTFAIHWERTPDSSENCDLAITPESATAGLNESVAFRIELQNRPASAPPVRIEVSTTLGELSGGSGTGAKTTLTGSGSVSFKSVNSGDAVITAEAFEGTESLGKVTATVTVGSVSGLVYSQLAGNIRGTQFPQSGPGTFGPLDIDGVPPLYSYYFYGKIPPPAAEVNTRECSIYLSRDIPTGTRVAVLGGSVGNPVAELTLAEIENEYDGQGNITRYRERAFQGISGHVTLLKIEGSVHTVLVENVKMRAYDRVYGGTDEIPATVEGQGTFVVNGTVTFKLQ